MQKIENLKTIFQIGDITDKKHHEMLILEIGPDHCSYAFFNKTSNSIEGLKFANIDEFTAEADVGTILEELSSKSFEDVVIASAYPTAMLTPLQYSNESNNLLDLVYDQPKFQILHDTINEWQIVNAYSIPPDILQILKYRFPGGKFLHVYTPVLKVYNGFASEDQIAVHFTTQYFRIVVKKSAQLHLAQIYSYKTPLDVIYYLLKICSELELHQSGIYLIISGLVDESSALYKEMQNYFMNIHFSHPPEVTVPQHDYPQHFFSSTYNLAACVS